MFPKDAVRGRRLSEGRKRHQCPSWGPLTCAERRRREGGKAFKDSEDSGEVPARGQKKKSKPQTRSRQRWDMVGCLKERDRKRGKKTAIKWMTQEEEREGGALAPLRTALQSELSGYRARF